MTGLLNLGQLRTFNGEMAQKRFSLSIAPDSYEMIRRAAELAGAPSLNEFIKIAAISRAAFTMARLDPETLESWEQLYEACGPAAHAAARRAYPPGDS